MAVACLSAIVVGLTATIFSCRIRGFSHFGYGTVLSLERDAFGWIALLDCIGALIGAVLLWAFLPSRADSLLAVNNSEPILFWAFFGALGPLFAMGFLKQLPGSIRLTDSKGNSKTQLRELRRSLSHEIYETADHLSRTWERTRSDWLARIVKDLHLRAEVHVDDLFDTIDNRSKRRPKKRLPLRWDDLKSERTAWPQGVRSDPGDLTIRVAHAALNAGFTYQVAEVCRVRATDFRFETAYSPPVVAGQPPAPAAEAATIEGFEPFDDLEGPGD